MTSSPLSQWYAAAFEVCQQWAPCCESASLGDVVKHFPAAAEVPPMNPAELAKVVSGLTDNRLTSFMVKEFRTKLKEYFATAVPSSPMNTQDKDAWHTKGVFELLCEMLLFTDLASLQREVVAIIAQAVQIFGRDASSVIAFCLCMRATCGWGRGAHTEETNWLAMAAVKTIQASEQYLVSEFFGDLSLAQFLAKLG